MARCVQIEAVYPGDPDAIFRDACDLAEMKAAMSGIARYEGMPDGRIAAGDQMTVRITLWGWLRLREHHIRVVTCDPQRRLIESAERNRDVRRWDHSLSLHPHPDGALWRDRIVLEAGGHREWLTARFCRFIYRHRHRARNARQIRCSITRPPS